MQDDSKHPRNQSALGIVALFLFTFIAAVFYPVWLSARPAVQKITRIEIVKQTALAIIMFSDDYNDCTPDMHNPQVMQEMLLPYTRSSFLLEDPISKRPLVPNAALSHVKLTEIDHPESKVLVYSPIVDDNGKRCVGFVDGHANNIPESEFRNDIALTGTYKSQLGPSLCECVAVCCIVAILAFVLWPITTGTGVAPPKMVRLSNVKQVALGLILYVNDYDDKLPSMADFPKFQDVLMPYIKSAALFLDPTSKQPLVPNLELSYKKLTPIQKPDNVVLVYSPIIEKDGTRGIGFADGHARDIPENEFIQDIALTGTRLGK
jgi:hypothetical protein